MHFFRRPHQAFALDKVYGGGGWRFRGGGMGQPAAFKIGQGALSQRACMGTSSWAYEIEAGENAAEKIRRAQRPAKY